MKVLIFKVLRFFFRTIGRVLPVVGGQVALRLFCTPLPVALSSPAKAFLDSSKRDILELAGADIEVFGKGEGETILLLHGWNSHCASLRAFAGPLIEKGYRILAVNLPAHGGSSGSSTTMLECSRVLTALIRHEVPVRGVIAHSFAGPATLLALRNNPDLPIARVVTVGSPIDMDKVMRDFSLRFQLTAATERSFRNRIDRVLGESLTGFDAPAVAASLSERMLVVHDVEDPDVPVAEAHVMASGEGVKSLITEGYGHNRILRRTPVIEHVVDFIAR